MMEITQCTGCSAFNAAEKLCEKSGDLLEGIPYCMYYPKRNKPPYDQIPDLNYNETVDSPAPITPESPTAAIEISENLKAILSESTQNTSPGSGTAAAPKKKRTAPKTPNPALINIRKTVMVTFAASTAPIHWIDDRKIWLQYNPVLGYYQVVSELIIVTLIKQFAGNVEVKPQFINEMLLNLKIDTQKNWADFTDKRYLACLNGIFDQNTHTLLPFDPAVFTVRHVKRNYMANVVYMPPLYNQMLEVLEPNKSTLKLPDGTPFPSLKHPFPADPALNQPTDREMWLRYCINLVHGYMDDRVLPMLIGAPDAGKSPNVRFIANMINSEMIVPIRIHLLGEKGECEDFLNAEIGYQEEGSMGYCNNETLAILKNNFSDDPTLSIRLLFNNTKNFKGGKFIFGATNQAFRMSDEYNAVGTFKRFMPLFCPNRFQKDVNLEKQFKDPAFLDEVFSFLLNQPITPVMDGWDQDTFQKRNMIIWNWSAYPVMRTCEMIYERCYEITAEIQESEVFKNILNEMQDQGAVIPKKFGKHVKDALELMGVSHTRRKGDGWFIGLKMTDIYMKKMVANIKPVDRPVMDKTIFN